MSHTTIVGIDSNTNFLDFPAGTSKNVPTSAVSSARDANSNVLEQSAERNCELKFSAALATLVAPPELSVKT
jgi:hypothetical protein